MSFAMDSLFRFLVDVSSSAEGADVQPPTHDDAAEPAAAPAPPTPRMPQVSRVAKTVRSATDHRVAPPKRGLFDLVVGETERQQPAGSEPSARIVELKQRAARKQIMPKAAASPEAAKAMADAELAAAKAATSAAEAKAAEAKAVEARATAEVLVARLAAAAAIAAVEAADAATTTDRSLPSRRYRHFFSKPSTGRPLGSIPEVTGSTFASAATSPPASRLAMVDANLTPKRTQYRPDYLLEHARSVVSVVAGSSPHSPPPNKSFRHQGGGASRIGIDSYTIDHVRRLKLTSGDKLGGKRTHHMRGGTMLAACPAPTLPVDAFAFGSAKEAGELLMPPSGRIDTVPQHYGSGALVVEYVKAVREQQAPPDSRRYPPYGIMQHEGVAGAPRRPPYRVRDKPKAMHEEPCQSSALGSSPPAMPVSRA